MTAPEQLTLSTHAAVQYHPQFIDAQTSKALLTQWTQELDWVRSEITLFGKKIPIPRLNAWYGDKPYSYSGTQFAAKPLTAELAAIKQEVEKISQLTFNSVLINWYRDGQDCMGWHSDDEASLGKSPQIASVSLGQCRRFLLREKKDHSNKRTINLENGSLLLMLGETQSQWQHSLPRSTKPMEDRINLTFRHTA